VNRRNFLDGLVKFCAAGTLRFPFELLLTSSAKADLNSRYFVAIHLLGGADCVIGLDPWKPTDLGGAWGRNKQPDDLRIYTNYQENQVFVSPQRSLFLGPAAHPLKEFCQNISVINGLETGIDDHAVSPKWQLQGDSGTTRESIATDYAFVAPSSYPILAIDGNQVALQASNSLFFFPS
jgi:hypothetical protein